MSDDINSVHIEYIKKSVDEIKSTLNDHIGSETETITSIKNDISAIKIKLAELSVKEKQNNDFRTGVISAIIAVTLLFIDKFFKH